MVSIVIAPGFTKQAFNQKVCKETLMNNDANRFSNLDFHIIPNHKISNWWLNLMMASVKNLAAQKLEEKSCPCQSHWGFCFWNPNTSLAWMMGRRVGMLTLCNYWSTYICCFMPISSWDYYSIDFWENLNKLSFLPLRRKQ